MKYNFPEKVKISSPNTIREVMQKGAKIEGFISFALGNPAIEAIPQEEILQAITEIISDNPARILQYGPHTGYDPLIEYTKENLKNRKGFDFEKDDLMLLSGSGQGLGFVPRVICNEGDVVFADEFTFPIGVNAARNEGLIVKSIKMDKEGMIPSELEKKAAEGKGKYIYLIPNFHNPMGMTMSIKRRQEIYEIAQKYDLFIYEDDPYGEIRFSGEPVPSFKNIDVDGRVIYAGSYSKTLSAGLRVGYLVADKEVIKVMQVVKGTVDGQAPLFNQMIVYHSLQKVQYDEYIKKLSGIYGRKCKLMTDSIREYCSDQIKFTEPEGGMFLWIEMPEYVDCDAFFEECLNKGVGIVSSIGFATDPEQNKGHAFRLNYTFVDDADIVKGIKILGEVSYKYCK